eukprot:Protomagalhaensia_wolfi_Nauph_80__1903@NODE_2196_length_1173_cov_42_110229_g1716_i0_p1_GENE_NODE_2196_length_1173_cov_42_110229_g1716_i0NODE_2196_length_1173_cov_42_110229_g1716_i0_p1_ORF_typecomplete_len369_score23_51_NODE_2196_length_1173_cov_42_110229_g1716_i0101116
MIYSSTALTTCLPRLIPFLSLSARYKLSHVNRGLRQGVLEPHWEGQALLASLKEHWAGEWPSEVVPMTPDELASVRQNHLIQCKAQAIPCLRNLFEVEDLSESSHEAETLPEAEKEPLPRLHSWHLVYLACQKRKGKRLWINVTESRLDNWSNRTVADSIHGLPRRAYHLLTRSCIHSEEEAWWTARELIRLYWEEHRELQLPFYALAMLKHSPERRKWCLSNPSRFIELTHSSRFHWTPHVPFLARTQRGPAVNNLGDMSTLIYPDSFTWEWVCKSDIKHWENGDTWPQHLFETQAKWLADRAVERARTWCADNRIRPEIDGFDSDEDEEQNATGSRYFAVWFNCFGPTIAIIGAYKRVDIYFTRIC